jgi:hypothetical protein
MSDPEQMSCWRCGLKVCEPVSLSFLWRPQLRDPGDEMVLEIAVNGSAYALRIPDSLNI